MNPIRAGSMLTAFVMLDGIAHAQYTSSLNPKNTYLHTNSDASGDAVPIDLAAIGVTPGTHLRMHNPGDYDNGPQGDTFNSLLGIFSATTTLLSESNLHRVQDAID